MFIQQYYDVSVCVTGGMHQSNVRWRSTGPLFETVFHIMICIVGVPDDFCATSPVVFIARFSVLTRDIYIAILSVCLSVTFRYRIETT